MISKFFEYKGERLPAKFKPIKSFYLKDELNPKIWNEDFELNSDVRENLLKLADDYIDHLKLDDIKIDDIIFTGSLANYNYSNYSDFDVHIVFDFAQVNKDVDLVEKFLDASEKLWKEHHDILILGYEIELYCQNSTAVHTSSGQFSLLKNKWLVKPTRENFVPDEKLIKRKAQVIMSKIDDLKIDYENNFSYDEISESLKKIWKKIKQNRRKGIETEGEFSIENLVFKLLRRNGYIGKLIELRTKVYDKQFENL
jgi:predicted nucleotidyltransferase